MTCSSKETYSPLSILHLLRHKVISNAECYLIRKLDCQRMRQWKTRPRLYLKFRIKLKDVQKFKGTKVLTVILIRLRFTKLSMIT